MKRVTIALEEDLYLELMAYAGEKSRRKVRRYSISEAIRDLLAEQMRTSSADMPRGLPAKSSPDLKAGQPY